MSDHNRFRMANGLLYRLFEEAKDWITGQFIHFNRETDSLTQVHLRSDRFVNYDPTKRNWETE